MIRVLVALLLASVSAALTCFAPSDAQAMRAVQEAERAGDAQAALDALRRGERQPTGGELIDIRLELADRLIHMASYDEAIEQLERVAEATDEVQLRRHVRHRIRAVREMAGTTDERRGAEPDSGRRGQDAPAGDEKTRRDPAPARDSVVAQPREPRSEARSLAGPATPGSATASPAGADQETVTGQRPGPCSVHGRARTARDKAVLAGTFLAGAAGLGVIFGRQRSRRY
jgi:hypothetical protein